MTGKQVQIISALGASQGSLAVIAALLAALSGHFVSNVHQGHLNNAHPYVVSIFYICGSVATVLPLFTVSYIYYVLLPSHILITSNSNRL